MLEFLATTFSKSFLAQYAAGKGLDSLISRIQESFSEKETINNIRELMYDSLLRLYTNYGWECDSTHVRDTFAREVNGIEDISAPRLYVILRELIGDNLFEERYVSAWKDIIDHMETDEKYKKVFKISMQKALKILSSKIDGLSSSFEKTSTRHIEESTESSEAVGEQFKKAYSSIYVEEYVEAIKILRKIIINSSDAVSKGRAFELMGFCEYRSDNIDKAIKDYKESLKFSVGPQEKVSRLCAIAKLYTKLGEENNKRENYKVANSWFQKILDIATLDEDIIEARVHIARNNMDMCDVVGIDDAKALLGRSIIEYIDVIYTYPVMDYEIGFVACQNLGRCFVQAAQKLGYFELIDLAEEIYLGLLQDEAIKEKLSWSALILDNLAELYYYKSTVDDANRKELFSKAKVTYKKALAIYKSLTTKESIYRTYNIRLDLASMEFSEYLDDNDVNHLKTAEEELLKLEKEYSYEKENSMHIRICLKMLEVLYKKALISDAPQVELEQMQKYILQAKSFDDIHSYEKYAIALDIFIIRKCYLDITLMNNEIDYLDCIEQLKELMLKTKDKNVNLYQIAEKTLLMFQGL